MDALEVRALGKLQLRYVDSSAVSFPTRHVEELLGFLLSHQQHLHPREKLVTLLWPESSMSEGRPRFNTVLWRLRQIFKQIGVVADDFLQTTREWVAFAPKQQYWFDVVRFEQRLEEARTATTVAHKERALRQAISFYQGDFCEGLYADWCLVERERLARLRLRAQGQLMALYMDDERYAAAIEIGQQILQDAPLREEVHKSLIYCYAEAGQRVQALRQFQLCASLLRQELQILPMRETIQLYERILHQGMPDHQSQPLDAELLRAFDEFQRAGQRLATLLNHGNGKTI